MKKNKKYDKKKIALIILIIVLIFIDQFTKIFMVNTKELSLIPNVLKFSVEENKSAAYGIGSNSTFMYAITTLVIIGTVLKFMMSQNEFIDTKQKILLALIVSGGISNLIDRICRGYVVEFINFKDWIPLPVLNIADILVLIGWVTLAAIFAEFTVTEFRKGKKGDKNIE